MLIKNKMTGLLSMDVSQQTGHPENHIMTSIHPNGGFCNRPPWQNPYSLDDLIVHTDRMSIVFSEREEWDRLNKNEALFKLLWHLKQKQRRRPVRRVRL